MACLALPAPLAACTYAPDNPQPVIVRKDGRPEGPGGDGYHSLTLSILRCSVAGAALDRSGTETLKRTEEQSQLQTINKLVRPFSIKAPGASGLYSCQTLMRLSGCILVTYPASDLVPCRCQLTASEFESCIIIMYNSVFL